MTTRRSAPTRGARPHRLAGDAPAALRPPRPGASLHTIQNAAYAARAIGVLGLRPLLDQQAPAADPAVAPYAWLVQPKLRHTIAAELGRIADVALLREVAVAVCRQQPGNDTAVALIRRWRLGAQYAPPGALTEELRLTITAFLHRYPRTPPRELLAALDAVRTAIMGSDAPAGEHGDETEDAAPAAAPVRLLGVHEAAARLRISRSLLRRWADTGRVAAYRLPGAGFRRFEPAEIERMRRELGYEDDPAE